MASKGAITETGQWKSEIQYGVRKLKITFSSELLSKLNKNWELFEFNNSQIRLRNVSTSTNYLYFENK